MIWHFTVITRTYVMWFLSLPMCSENWTGCVGGAKNSIAHWLAKCNHRNVTSQTSGTSKEKNIYFHRLKPRPSVFQIKKTLLKGFAWWINKRLNECLILDCFMFNLVKSETVVWICFLQDGWRKLINIHEHSDFDLILPFSRIDTTNHTDETLMLFKRSCVDCV